MVLKVSNSFRYGQAGSVGNENATLKDIGDIVTINYSQQYVFVLMGWLH